MGSRWGWLWLLAGGALIWLVARQVAWPAALEALRQLRPWQIGVLLLLNLAMLLPLFGRWQQCLRGLGHPLPLRPLARYALGGFAVSYLTPGPQFGGEPLQIYLLGRHHQIPTATAAASLTLDRALGLLTSFAFLLFALALVLPRQLLGVTLQPTPLLPLLLPLLLLAAWLHGRRPLSRLAPLLPPKLGHPLAATEEEVANFCRRQQRLLLRALLLSLLSWGAYLLEFWAMVRFLGLPLSPAEGITLIAASRVAFLLPSPGALGTLEASQVWALGAMGYEPAVGLTLSLLIRARDLLLALFGLWWSGAAALIRART